MHNLRTTGLALYLSGLVMASGCSYKVQSFGYTREIIVGNPACQTPLETYHSFGTHGPASAQESDAVQFIGPTCAPPLADVPKPTPKILPTISGDVSPAPPARPSVTKPAVTAPSEQSGTAAMDAAHDTVQTTVQTQLPISNFPIRHFPDQQ